MSGDMRTRHGRSPVGLAPAIGLSLLLGGCLVVTDDNEHGARSSLSVEFYWQEPADVRASLAGELSCESAGVDRMALRLLDADGKVVDCYPSDDDGECLPGTDACYNGVDMIVDPGSYRLEVDGYRDGCEEPLWALECIELHVDRFDEAYRCDVALTAECVPVDETGDDEDSDTTADNADAGT